MLLLLTPALAGAQTVTAAWDPNPPEDGVTSYEVCIGTGSLQCDGALAPVGSSETSHTFSPENGIRQFVAVRGVSAVGVGEFSDELSFSIPGFAQPSAQSSTVGTPIVPVTFDVVDPDESPLAYSHTGLPVGLSIDAVTGEVSGTPTAAGSYGVTVFVTDDLVTVSRAFTWTVAETPTPDLTAPTIALTSHTPGQALTTPSVTVAGTASDAGRGESGITTVTVNGQPAAGGTATGGDTANWSRALTLAAGSNTISLEATDGAGNLQLQQFELVYRAPDTTAPSLDVTSHASGQVVSTATVTLAGTADDAGSGVAEVTVNGQPANGTTAWSRTLTLAPGDNAITVAVVDEAGNAASESLTLVYEAAVPLTITSLTSDLPSPQQVGTAVTFTAAAAGGEAPYQFKWWLWNGGTWVPLRDWGGPTVTWTPVEARSDYQVGVWARSAGETADSGDVNQAMPFTVTAPPPPPDSTAPGLAVTSHTAGQVVATASVTLAGTAADDESGVAAVTVNGEPATGTTVWSRILTLTPGANALAVAAVDEAGNRASQSLTLVYEPPAVAPLTISSLASDLPSPQPRHSTITFVVTAAGGEAPYEFKWWTYDGRNCRVAQEWSTDASMRWRPTREGSYQVSVWARSAGSRADAGQAIDQLPFEVTSDAGSAPLAVTGLISDRPSPQQIGTAVTFTAVASDGDAPYQFKWWVHDGESWEMARDWQEDASMTWQPTVAGSYEIGVWVRNAGSTEDAAEAQAQVSFLVSDGVSLPGLRVTSLSADLASPQPRRTTVTFVAAAAGGQGPYEYKWWVYDGRSWRVEQDWGDTATFDWEPRNRGSYVVAVWIRDDTNTDDAAQATAQLRYVIE